MLCTIVTIEKLSTPIRSGDHHDKPLKWAVYGPAGEVQLFATKDNAKTYRRCRLSTKTLAEAARQYTKS